MDGSGSWAVIDVFGLFWVWLAVPFAGRRLGPYLPYHTYLPSRTPSRAIPQLSAITMADTDCWGAFGSDSDDSDDEKGVHSEDQGQQAADAAALALVHHFVSLAKSTGVSLKERVVGTVNYHDDDGHMERWQEMMVERVSGRGMKAAGVSGDFICDAAILMKKEDSIQGEGGKPNKSSCIKRDLLPGGLLYLMIILDKDLGVDAGGCNIRTKLKAEFSEATWELDSASVVYSSSDVQVISVQKRTCVINSWSCKWMDKDEKIPSQLLSNVDDEFPISSTESTYLQYERKVASAVTISPSVAERTREV